jgi:hypothetical protein
MSKKQQPIEEKENKKDEAKRLGRNIVQKKYNKNESCPLCLCEMKNTKVQHTLCGHTFHSSCLEQQFKSNFNNNNKCALCRVNIYDKNTHPELARHGINVSERYIYTSPSGRHRRHRPTYYFNHPNRMRLISLFLDRQRALFTPTEFA